VHSISGFRHGVVDTFALLGFCVAHVGSVYHPTRIKSKKAEGLEKCFF